MSNLDDDFDDDNFDDEDQDAKLADETDSGRSGKISALEKRRLIDDMLEKKRLERELDDLDDDLEHLDDFSDLDDDWADDRGDDG